MDYIANAYGFHLEPYFVDVNPDYETGINFAEAGATAQNTSFRTPFYFSLQVAQFLQFKQRVLSSYKEHGGRCEGSLPPRSFFTDFGYVIEFGRNDIGYNLLPTFGNNQLLKFVIQLFHKLLLPFEQPHRFYMIREQGYFLCLAYPHRVLKDAVDALRTQYTDSQFFFADLYNSYFEITNNTQKYGLTDVQNACCGTGAPYNYSPSRLCGTPGVPFCPNPSSFVSWDGRHYTQWYYQIQADLILSGKYLDPSSDMLCYPASERDLR